jgi:hypothetical protein
MTDNNFGRCLAAFFLAYFSTADTERDPETSSDLVF